MLQPPSHIWRVEHSTRAIFQMLLIALVNDASTFFFIFTMFTIDITLCLWYYKWLHIYHQHNYSCVDGNCVVIYRTRVNTNENVPQLLTRPLLKIVFMLMVFWVSVPCSRWVFRRLRGSYCCSLQSDWFWFTWMLKWLGWKGCVGYRGKVKEM
jgi:hypothetical protein